MWLRDLETTATTSSARPTSYHSHQAARAHHSFTLGELIVAAIQAAGAIARRAHARQRRPAQAIYDALHQLDDRTLVLPSKYLEVVIERKR